MSMRSFIGILLVCASALAFVPSAGAQTPPGKRLKPFKDPADSAFDISYYLGNLHGFLPVVMPITEPAVGYGAAVAGAFFIPKKKDTTKAPFKIPDIAAVAGGVTSNKTWFVGAAYLGFWKQDHIRYRGIFGYGDVRLKYYGEGGGYLEKNPAKFTIKSYFLLQQVIFRVGESKFLLGGRYLFGKSKVTFLEDSQIPGVNPQDMDFTNSGIGFISEYDNLNNYFSPTKGLRVNLSYNQFLTFLGSDRNFGRLSFHTLYYLPVTKIWISGFRLETLLETGDAPFYMQPFIALRGVPAMRYQGALTALIETEQQVLVTKRWSVVGFAGFGKAYANLDELAENSSTAWSAGAGFRYLLARLFGLRMGVDVARGPEKWAFYVVVGSAWLK
jgi:hypothetical protein